MKHYSIHFVNACLILFLSLPVHPGTALFAASNNDNLPVTGSDSKTSHDSPSEAKDREAPYIDLESMTDTYTVYTDQIYIYGKVVDASPVRTLTLNNTSILKSPGRSVVFSHLEKVSEGKNIFEITATDAEGNRAKKQITVKRVNLPLSQLPKEIIEKRMRIAVYPFEKSGIVSEESRVFMDLLMQAFHKEKRFQLTDRELMERILEEQKLSLTQLIDQNSAVNMGRIMSAQAIITGSIIETPGGTEVVGRVIDSETSEIMATENIHSGTKGLEALNFLAESMAVQIHNDFPMSRGAVIRKKEGHLFTDLGRTTIPLRGRIIVYRTNKLKGRTTILGYARITQVLPDMSQAELINGSLNEIRELDPVVVQ